MSDPRGDAAERRPLASDVVGDAGGRPAVRGANRAKPIAAAVIGQARELAGKKLDRVYTVEHELLAKYTADGYTAALEQLIRKANPTIVLFPHTYQVRDFAPKLATRFDQVLISDVIGRASKRARRSSCGSFFRAN